MAKIKIFEGAGPNPNVSFTNLAPSRYAGATGDAVAKVANNFTQQAIKYAEYQKKQTDVAQEVQATGEKQKFVASARANALQPDGTYDVATLEKALTDFDGQLKQSISKDAYQSYSLKESQKNAHMIATAQNDNLKITRKNNLNSFQDGVKNIITSAASGSFEDMLISKNEALEYASKGVVSGMVLQPEADKLIKESLSETAKVVLDDLSTLGSKSLSEVESSFQKAELFIEADPLGAFAADPLLKTEAISDLRRKRLSATTQALAKEEAQAARADRAEKRMQKKNFQDTYTKYSEALASDDFEKILEVQAEITELRDSEGIDIYHADKLSKLPQQRVAQDDNLIVGQIMQDPTKVELLDSIQTPAQRAFAEKFLSTIPSGFEKAYKSNIKLMGGDKVRTAQGLRNDSDSIAKLPPSEDNFTSEDLSALYAYYPMMLDPTNPQKNIAVSTDSKDYMGMTSYINSLNKKGALLDVGGAAARLGRLRKALDLKNKELEDERARAATTAE